MDVVVGRIVLGNRESGDSLDHQMIRYANDLLLAELAIQINKELGSMNEYLRDGNLGGAFLRAHTLTSRLESLMERLNDIKFGRADVPTGTP